LEKVEGRRHRKNKKSSWVKKIRKEGVKVVGKR